MPEAASGGNSEKMATKKARPGRKQQFTHYEFIVKFKVPNSHDLTKRDVASALRETVEDHAWFDGPVRATLIWVSPKAK